MDCQRKHQRILARLARGTRVQRQRLRRAGRRNPIPRAYGRTGAPPHKEFARIESSMNERERRLNFGDSRTQVTDRWTNRPPKQSWPDPAWPAAASAEASRKKPTPKAHGSSTNPMRERQNREHGRLLDLIFPPTSFFFLFCWRLRGAGRGQIDDDNSNPGGTGTRNAWPAEATAEGRLQEINYEGARAPHHTKHETSELRTARKKPCGVNLLATAGRSSEQFNRVNAF